MDCCLCSESARRVLCHMSLHQPHYVFSAAPVQCDAGPTMSVVVEHRHPLCLSMCSLDLCVLLVLLYTGSE